MDRRLHERINWYCGNKLTSARDPPNVEQRGLMILQHSPEDDRSTQIETSS